MRTQGRTARRSAEAQGSVGSARPPRRPLQLTRSGAPRFQFGREIVSELKKVTWPTREQTVNLTFLVIVISLAIGLLLGLIDWAFLQIVDNFLLGVGR